jgi:UDP-N-acetylmuramyl pentapeptide phosphotransferase/UDP-N-acetylglucosamine-1-phosphate transferase
MQKLFLHDSGAGRSAVIIAGVILVFVLSAWLTWRFCDPASRFHILDHPNERSLHTRSTPRSGGLAILVSIIVSVAMISVFQPFREMEAIMASVFLVAGVSFLDDRYSIFPVYRFIVHVLASAAILYGGFYLPKLEVFGISWQWPYLAGAVITVLYTVWMINLYNFMDGMDGFAGGMAVAGFGTFAILGWQAGNIEFMLMSLVIASAAGGFLVFNFPPARIFMGDVGSSTLGLLAAAFSLWGARENIFPFWIALLVFSPFMVDATVTLLRRLLRGEKIWQAHKSHYYQQLVQAGWGHRKTVLVEYGIMLGCGMTALWGLRASANVQAALIAGWAVFYFLFFFSVSRLVARHKKTGTP